MSRPDGCDCDPIADAEHARALRLERERLDPAAEPLSPVDEIVRLSAEAGLYGDLAATAAAEAYAQAAALARVEALRVEWETSDVRLSRRFAANELRRAMEGTDG